MNYQDVISNGARNRAIAVANLNSSKDLIIAHTDHTIPGPRIVLHEYNGYPPTGYNHAEQVLISDVTVNIGALAVGRFNESSAGNDIVFGEGSNIKVYQNIDNNYIHRQTFDIGVDIKDIHVADVNFDGVDDIGVVEGGYAAFYGRIRVFLCIGAGTFNTTPAWTAPNSGPYGGDDLYAAMAFVDYNQDNYPDILLNDSENIRKFIFNNTCDGNLYPTSWEDFDWISDYGSGSPYASVMGSESFDCECTGGYEFCFYKP